MITGYLFPYQISGLVAVLLLIGLFDLILSARWVRSTDGISYDPDVRHVRVEILDQGIAESSGSRDRRWAWSAVRQVADRGSALVIRFAGWDMIVLPARLSPNETARHGFLDEVERQVPVSAFTRNRHGSEASGLLPETLLIVAIAAGVDVAFAAMWLLPALIAFGTTVVGFHPISGVIMMILVQLIGAVGAFFFARWAFPRLHRSAPIAASVVQTALIWWPQLVWSQAVSD